MTLLSRAALSILIVSSALLSACGGGGGNSAADAAAFCQDGVDNDQDGWTDAEDPDCLEATEERGFGTASCNDGLDNDGDALVDSSDPECGGGTWHEVLGDGACVDVCAVGAVDDGLSCALWSDAQGAWLAFDDSVGNMHNRARGYSSSVRDGNMAAGGVFATRYTDTTYTTVASYDSINDSAIWTGTYLASEALRLLSTGAHDARGQIARTVDTLHDWWTISGDVGYLARFAAPADSPPPVQAVFDAARPRDHMNVTFKGKAWHWKGDVSRDQYQGVLLGYSLAYDAIDDEQVRAIIREDVVTFVQQLMRSDIKDVSVTLNGLDYVVQVEMPYTVFTDDETANGQPRIVVDLDDLENAQTFGFREFHPRVSDIYRQIPGLGFLPDVPRPGTAIMLGAAFRVALQVTENVASYASQRAAILDFYRDNVDEWLSIADDWSYTQTCGEDYFGIHIAYQPAYNWARLETDVAIRDAIRRDVIRDQLWSEVADHNNVLFAFITAAQVPDLPDASAILVHHAQQLALFPPAPRVREARDNTGAYPESTACPGRSTVALNLDERGIYTYLWQKDPWKLARSADLQMVYPGVDYLIAYWLGRYHAFIAEDAGDTCLQWRR